MGVILEGFNQCSHHRAVRRWWQKQLYGQKCVLGRIDSEKGSQGVQVDQTACPLVVVGNPLYESSQIYINLLKTILCLVLDFQGDV